MEVNRQRLAMGTYINRRHALFIWFDNCPEDIFNGMIANEMPIIYHMKR